MFWTRCFRKRAEGDEARRVELPDRSAAGAPGASGPNDTRRRSKVTVHEALSIYVHPVLDHNCRIWVEKCDKDEEKRKDISSNTWIVAFNGTEEQHLKVAVERRSPVYYGEPVTEAFNAVRLKWVLGYTIRDVESRQMVRYTVVAPNYARRRGRFHTVHVMGVNLESIDTHDYVRMVHNGDLDVDQYQKEVEGVFRMIQASVDKVMDNSVDAPNVRMPAWGMGNYLYALKETDRQHCQQVFMKSLINFAQSRQSWQVQLCLYPKLEPWAEHLKHEFPANLTVQEADLFAVSEVTSSLFLVNARDTMSFIGNGGTKEQSIDGMMVAGVFAGAKFVNCSYLHNPFFWEPACDMRKVLWVDRTLPTEDIYPRVAVAG